jgi:GntR family transcriptional regulator
MTASKDPMAQRQDRSGTRPPTATSPSPPPSATPTSSPGGHIARINAVSPVTEIREEITARMPASPEAARLDIPEGTPVLEVIRTYHTAEGALDVARFIIRANMAAFDYRFPVPD